LADFPSLGDWPEFEQILPIAKILLDGFQKGEFHHVFLVFNDFVSTLRQLPTARQLLPIMAETLKSEETEEAKVGKFIAKEYLFEPDPKTILQWLLPYYFEMQIYQALLEALASEHSARMVSMKNASDSAKEITADLTLGYNKIRQQKITVEINEVTVANLALNTQAQGQ
jgi:F-type H+-transporting ATPase subunit gamma